jgi:hypothetical protein
MTREIVTLGQGDSLTESIPAARPIAYRCGVVLITRFISLQRTEIPYSAIELVNAHRVIDSPPQIAVFDFYHLSKTLPPPIAIAPLSDSMSDAAAHVTTGR